MFRTEAALLTFVTALTVIPATAVSAAQGPRKVRLAPVLNIAHRGASAYAPENTLVAFRLAGQQGADLAELDVQQTKDRKLVVIHDVTLARTTNVEKVFPKLKPWRVKDLTLRQIKRLDAGSWFGPIYRNERIPTLAEALTTVEREGMGLMLELKKPTLYPGMTDRTVAVLRSRPYWSLPGKLIVQSFYWRYVKAFHIQMPLIRTAVLGHPAPADLAGIRWYSSAVNAAYRPLTESYVSQIHGQWMKAYGYVVNDKANMRRLMSYGLDGIVTNRPDAAREVIEQRADF
jgi:glycerophosphoryl diester phosphodiesterase